MHLNIDCFAILCNIYKFLSGHLYDWVKKGKGLGDAKHDEGEIEEDDPERRKHLEEKHKLALIFEISHGQNTNIHKYSYKEIFIDFYRGWNGWEIGRYQFCAQPVYLVPRLPGCRTNVKPQTSWNIIKLEIVAS